MAAETKKQTFPHFIYEYFFAYLSIAMSVLAFSNIGRQEITLVEIFSRDF